jgi:hypothetical protein
MSSQGQVNPAGPGNGQNLDSGPTSRIDVPPNQLSHRNNAKISSPATPSGRSGPSTRVSQRENASETSSSDNVVSRPNRGRPEELTRFVTPEEGESNDQDMNMEKYGAGSVIKLFIPVTICMTLVVFSIQTLDYYVPQDDQQNFIIYTPFHPKSDDSTGTKLWQSLANSLIMISVIGVMTFGLVLLYKKGYMKVIHVWLFLSSLMLIFMFGYMYLSQVLRSYNLALDYITLSIVMWNFGVVGIISIHFVGPLLVQQAYLIICSTLMALVFIKYLPDWTTWFILAVLSIYDLAAVLLPYGPLRMLVETAQDRDDELFPALIYSSGAGVVVPVVNTGLGMFAPLLGMANESSPEPTTPIVQIEQPNQREPSASSRPSRRQRRAQEGSRDDIKLGLGDFIFYSVLVGKASVGGDWNVVLACAVSILVGLGGTLTLLSIYKKALPALPISITLGLIFYFSTQFIVTPFMERCIVQQVFL